MSILDGFSSPIAQPEGAFALLSQKDAEQLRDLLQKLDPITLETIIEGGTGGATAAVWARVIADGTKVAGNTTGVTLSAARSSEGIYTVTASSASDASGGYNLYGVIATASGSTSGGGDGSGPYSAYASHDVVDTDDFCNATQEILAVLYSPQTNCIYVPGPTSDTVFKHDLDNFTATATQVDPSRTIIEKSAAGVMDREGAYLWLACDSGGGGQNLKCIDLSDDSVIDFGSVGGANFPIYGAATINGVYYLIAHDGSATKVYTPTGFGGTPALGTGTTIFAYTIASGYSVRGVWDNRNCLWVCSRAVDSGHDSLGEVDPVQQTIAWHDYPQSSILTPIGVTASLTFCDPVFDKIRNQIIFSIGDAGFIETAIIRYYGYSKGVANSGTFELITAAYDGVMGMWHDHQSDVLLMMDYNGKQLIRWHVGSAVEIDSVSIEDQTSPDNPEVDYKACGGHILYYSSPYAYIIGNKSSNNKLIRVSYTGSAITTSTGSGVLTQAALAANYIIDSATQATIYIYRSLDPMVLVDGEFTVHFLGR